MSKPRDPLGGDLRTFLPPFRAWVESITKAHAAAARGLSSCGFQRLPLYYPGPAGERLLREASFVPVDTLPRPPLADWGLEEEFRWYTEMDVDAITYGNTYFMMRRAVSDESTHLHELVHVVQWGVLGFDNFALAYALGLRAGLYRDHILEVIAYDHQSRFKAGGLSYDVGMATLRQMQFLFGAGTVGSSSSG